MLRENILRQKTDLEQKLAEIPNDEYVVIALSQDKGFMQEFKIIADTAGHLKERVAEIWLGDTKLRSHEFLFTFGIYPEHNAIHLHEVSIGREHQDMLEGKRLAAEFAERFSDALSDNYRGMKISTVALEEQYKDKNEFKFVPDMVKRYFSGRHTTGEELESVRKYVDVDPQDYGYVYIGEVGKD